MTDRELTAEEIKNIKHLFTIEKIDRDLISQQMGISRDLVDQIIRDKSIEGKNSKTWKCLNPENIQKVRDLYNNKTSRSEIMRQTGISLYYIDQILNNKPVPLNGTHKNPNIHGVSNRIYGQRLQSIKNNTQNNITLKT